MKKILFLVVVALISAIGVAQQSDSEALTPEQEAIMADADAIISQGNEAYSAGDYATAIQIFGRVAAIDPWYQDAGKRQILALVRATLARGDRGATYDAAVSAFDLLKDASSLPEDLAVEVAEVRNILENLPEEVEVQAMAPLEITDDPTAEEQQAETDIVEELPTETDPVENDPGEGAAGMAAAVAAGSVAVDQPGGGAADVVSTSTGGAIEVTAEMPEPTPTPPPPTPTPAPTAAPTPVPTAVPTAVPTPAGPVEDVVETQMEAIPPVLIKKVPPVYPRRAWSMRVEGDVHLQILVESDGSVGDVRITEVPREGVGFEQVVTATVNKWKFQPATQDGEPIRAWVPIRIPFRMRSR